MGQLSSVTRQLFCQVLFCFLAASLSRGHFATSGSFLKNTALHPLIILTAARMSHTRAHTRVQHRFAGNTFVCAALLFALQRASSYCLGWIQNNICCCCVLHIRRETLTRFLTLHSSTHSSPPSLPVRSSDTNLLRIATVGVFVCG